MEASDKAILKSGNHIKALGENYNNKPIYVMIFKDKEFIDQLDERFTSIEEAELKIPKIDNVFEYRFGNINDDWL